MPPPHQLTLDLLTHFKTPVPGVSPSQFALPGHSALDASEGLHRLIASGLLELRTATDARGWSYAGHLVAITPAGRLVLEFLRSGVDDIPGLLGIHAH